MRIVGLALTGMLAVSAVTPADTDPLGSKMEPARRARPGLSKCGTAVVRAGTTFSMAQVVAGIRHPIMPESGKGDRFHRIGLRTVILAGGVRLEHGAAPTVYGEAPTFPTAATVTGARCGIPTQNREARRAAVVIRSLRRTSSSS